MQTTPQIYKTYTNKCIDKNIKPLSINLFKEKIKSQILANLNTGFVFKSDFDAFDYLFDNNLHFRKSNKKTKLDGRQNRVTKSSIAKMLEISRSALNEKLLLATNYPHIKRLKHLIEKSVEKNTLAQNDFVEIKKLAKITVNVIKKIKAKKIKAKKIEIQKLAKSKNLIYEISSNLISN